MCEKTGNEESVEMLLRERMYLDDVTHMKEGSVDFFLKK